MTKEEKKRDTRVREMALDVDQAPPHMHWKRPSIPELDSKLKMGQIEKRGTNISRHQATVLCKQPRKSHIGLLTCLIIASLGGPRHASTCIGLHAPVKCYLEAHLPAIL